MHRIFAESLRNFPQTLRPGPEFASMKLAGTRGTLTRDCVALSVGASESYQADIIASPGLPPLRPIIKNSWDSKINYILRSLDNL